jgi:hypothetical protein
MRLRMLSGETSECLAPASSVIEVRDIQHEVGLSMPINLMYNMSTYIGGLQGLRMVSGETSECLAPASSVIEVRDNQHEVRLSMPINFMYNMSI